MLQLLSEDGFSVEWLRDGRSAIARIDEGFRPDAILMDYKLPHADGFALARNLTRACIRASPASLMKHPD